MGCRQAMVLVMAMAVLGGCRGGFATAKPVSAAASLPAGAPPSITVTDLLARQAKGEQPLVIDVRPPEAFQRGHLSGAVNVPGATLRQVVGQLPRDKPIVLYCACAHDEASILGASELIARYGLRNVAYLAGGIRAWQAAGQATES